MLPLPKICAVGLEAHHGAAPAGDFAEGLDFADGNAPGIFLLVELLAAGHFDDAMFGQRVHHGDAHAMEAAGGFIDLRVEFAAGMERGHDHFEGGLVLELGVRVDGNAAAVVGDGEIAIGTIFTSIQVAWPATASSMALSMTSEKRWCRAFSSVPPIYMPGRRRTGSSPSSTSMSAAVYCSSPRVLAVALAGRLCSCWQVAEKIVCILGLGHISKFPNCFGHYGEAGGKAQIRNNGRPMSAWADRPPTIATPAMSEASAIRLSGQNQAIRGTACMM